MAAISARMLDVLANQYAQGMSRIQIAAELAASDAWFAHNGFDSERDDEWTAQFWLILFAAAAAVAALAARYYEAQRDYLGIAPRVPDVDITDRLAEAFVMFGASPAVRARYLISQGMSPQEAIAEAAKRVSVLTSTAIRDAEQAVIAELMDRIEVETVWEFVEVRPDEFFFPEDNDAVDRLATQMAARGYRMSKKGKGALRWKRVPQMGACGWCIAQSSRLLSDATRDRGAGWHTFCRCGWRKVTETESQSWTPMPADEFKALLSQRAMAETTGDDET